MKFWGPLAGLASLCLAVSVGEISAGELQQPSPGRFERWGNYSDKMEVRFGLLSYDTGIAGTKHRFDGVNINGELLFRSPELLEAIGSPRPMLSSMRPS